MPHAKQSGSSGSEQALAPASPKPKAPAYEDVPMGPIPPEPLVTCPPPPLPSQRLVQGSPLVAVFVGVLVKVLPPKDPPVPELVAPLFPPDEL
jgi:hypothetical protein